MTTCARTGCDRAAAPTSHTGIVHTECADHEREALSVFGADAWHDHATADVLRPSVVGGIPTSPARAAAPSRLPGHPVTPRSAPDSLSRSGAERAVPAL